MDQESQKEHRKLLKAQIRETYGRVIYSHKTHEKCADILLEKNTLLKRAQIILSGITTTSLFGILADLLSAGTIFTIVGSLASTALLILNLIFKEYNFEGQAAEHKQTAQQLWKIREDYLTLLTDFPILRKQRIISKREIIQEQLYSIYRNSPPTNGKAYVRARNALKNNEELTFSSKEIDLFLPINLRENKHK